MTRQVLLLLPKGSLGAMPKEPRGASIAQLILGSMTLHYRAFLFKRGIKYIGRRPVIITSVFDMFVCAYRDTPSNLIVSAIFEVPCTDIIRQATATMDYDRRRLQNDPNAASSTSQVCPVLLDLYNAPENKSVP